MCVELCDFRDRGEFSVYVASARSIAPKGDLIRTLCAGKDALDVGCIDHSWQRALELGAEWPFLQIKRVAKSVVGLDILGADARKLAEYGYEIIEGNAENFDLGRTFDVIICGDIIEHLSNIGCFLDSVARHMGPNSLCLVTTPNPFNVEQLMLAIFHGRIGVNQQHRVWMDPQVMYELISRSGLRVVGFRWVKTRFEMPVLRRGFGWLINALSGFIMKRRPLCNRDFAVILRRK